VDELDELAPPQVFATKTDSVLIALKVNELLKHHTINWEFHLAHDQD